ncbi:hypothetical protein ElyMa_003550700 [Elysia marginata]|uniref:Transmembrane protein n=1 Tax=Elysia marginata TaxID=1093978 RepID=A0AAV4EJA7_9GAST|nr:hypothetical protein ElyMa_003550700 [Elysia marginata]
MASKLDRIDHVLRETSPLSSKQVFNRLFLLPLLLVLALLVLVLLISLQHNKEIRFRNSTTNDGPTKRKLTKRSADTLILQLVFNKVERVIFWPRLLLRKLKRET